jgi:hypothetical protein
VLGVTYHGLDLSWMTRADTMRGPYATLYDLDYCWNKLINTLYWPNFVVTASLVGGDPSGPLHNPEGYGHAVWSLTGDTPLLCSDEDGVLADSGEFSGPKRPPFCSDLSVQGTMTCHFYPAQPRPCTCEAHRPRDLGLLIHRECLLAGLGRIDRDRPGRLAVFIG